MGIPTCEARVERSRYMPGEAIRGEVLCTADDASVETSVSIALQWRVTDHRRERDRGTYSCVDVARATRRSSDPADAHRFPFELRAPETPPSYAGELMSVSWRLVARLHAGATEIAQCESAVEISREPATQREPAYRLSAAPAPQRNGLFADSEPVPQVGTRLVAYGTGALILTAGATLAALVPLAPFAAMVSLLSSASVATIAARWLRRPHRRARQLGFPSVFVEGDTTVPSALHVRLLFEPRHYVAVSAVRFKLSCYEVVQRHLTDGADTRRVYHHVTNADAVSSGLGAHAYAAVLAVPQKFPPSFSVGCGAIAWTLRVEILSNHHVLWCEEHAVRIALGA